MYVIDMVFFGSKIEALQRNGCSRQLFFCLVYIFFCAEFLTALVCSVPCALINYLLNSLINF